MLFPHLRKARAADSPEACALRLAAARGETTSSAWPPPCAACGETIEGAPRKAHECRGDAKEFDIPILLCHPCFAFGFGEHAADDPDWSPLV